MSKERNYGIDILRILSMLAIIGLHVLGIGGVLNSASFPSFNYVIVYLFEIVFFCSVNVFAMITGYLYIDRKDIKLSSIIILIFQILYYCLIITLTFYSFNLFSIRETGIINLITALFPIIVGRYWYIVCYVFVFVMIPYINSFINNISKEQLKKCLIVLFLLLSLFTTFGLRDYFKIVGGYSPFWLIYCYMIGSYIRKYCTKKSSTKKKTIIFLLSSLLTMFFHIGMYILTNKLFGEPKGINLFMEYVSPTIIINAICIFNIFKDLKLNSNKFKKIILKLSNAAFGVYVIHCHILICDYLIADNFKYLANLNSVLLVLIIPIILIIIYLICFIFDIIRIYVFKILKVELLATKIEKLINNIGKKIIKISL